MSKTRRKKNEEAKRRFEAIKDLMSTFAMTTIAVVAAVTLIPASPKAEVVKAVALSEEIVYQVNVTDEDNALELSTLFVVLENQLEYYEQSVSLGENSGYFDSLEYDTEYRLSVYGNKGFGQDRLDTLMITTGDKIGGTILSVTPEVIDFSTSYIVDVAVNDPESKYSSINLYYGYATEHDIEIHYSSVPVTSSRMDIELFDIFTSEPFHIYLEGTTLEGIELLDEIWVTPPFELYASVHRSYIDSEEIGFSVYSDLGAENIYYEMSIYIGEILIRTDQIILDNSDYGDSEFVIGDLSPNTNYILECIAVYTNPQTLRTEQKNIYQEEITTLDIYSYSYSVETFDEFLEATIVLNDPSNYFDIAYYESYDTSDDFDIFLDGETYMFNDIDNEKSVSFTIFLPTASAYEITIGIRNQFDFSIKKVIDIITFE
jgi:hypothetical protein